MIERISRTVCDETKRNKEGKKQYQKQEFWYVIEIIVFCNDCKLVGKAEMLNHKM